MKRLFTLVLLLAMTLALFSCSNNSGDIKYLSKEGIAPYELTESEKYILQSFEMQRDAHILSFNAPKEAASMYINIYRLNDTGGWDEINGSGGGIYRAVGADEFKGSLIIEVLDNYSIKYNINISGTTSTVQSDGIILDNKVFGSMIGYLQEYKEIEINKEIPVAIMHCTSKNMMFSYPLDDYFTPENFQGEDLVQVVTVEFRDE